MPSCAPPAAGKSVFQMSALPVGSASFRSQCPSDRKRPVSFFSFFHNINKYISNALNPSISKKKPGIGGWRGKVVKYTSSYTLHNSLSHPVSLFLSRREAGYVWCLPLSEISGLSFDSTLLSPFLFFCLILLLFLPYLFSAGWSIHLSSFQKILQYFSLRDRLFCMVPIQQLGEVSCHMALVFAFVHLCNTLKKIHCFCPFLFYT